MEEMPAREAQYGEPSFPLSLATQRALAARGVSRMFSHQAAALDHVLAGRHTVIATSTASGK